MRIILTNLVCGSLALAVTLSITVASGQEKSAEKPPAQANSSAETKSRTRRVTPKAPDETTGSKPLVNAPTENDAKPTVTTTNPKEHPTADVASGSPDEKQTASSSLVPDDIPKGTIAAPDNLKSLRDQIAAAASGSERIRLQLKLSEILVASGKKAEAIMELRTIIAAEEFDPQGFYNAGNALARLGQADEAGNAYRKAISQRKGNYSRALNNLGVILLRQGRWDEAYEALLSALKLESFHYAEASYNLGRLYSARGESDLAAREWRRTLSIDPEHSAAALALSLGTPEAVVKRAEPSAKAPRATRDDTRMPGLSAGNTEATERLGNSSSPNRAMTKVLTLDPVSYEFLQRARNLRDRGKHQQAVENYRSVLSRSHGYFPPANLELSYALLTLNRNDEAFANLSEIAKRDGGLYPITYFYLARLYEARGNLKEAEELFTKVHLAYKGKNSSFLLDMSRVRERQGNFKGALAAMEEYLTAMGQEGIKPSWADERLAALRQKADAESK